MNRYSLLVGLLLLAPSCAQRKPAAEPGTHDHIHSHAHSHDGGEPHVHDHVHSHVDLNPTDGVPHEHEVEKPGGDHDHVHTNDPKEPAKVRLRRRGRSQWD